MEDSKSFEDYREILHFLIYEKGMGRRRIAKELDIHPSRAQRWVDKIKKELRQLELVDTDHVNTELAKQNQKLSDKNRIIRKVFRESSRLENAVEEYTKELIGVFSENELSHLSVAHDSDGGAVAIIQFSDAHFNELIDIDGNNFDFDIGCRRVAKYASRVKKYLAPWGVKNILLAITGDLMNSDRRLDEMVSKATNRSCATFLVVDILQQFILDLNKDYNVSVACVTGNESRVNHEIGWVAEVASDNYDFTIFNCLKFIFRGSEGISFIEGDPVELVVNVAGQNVLLLHGNGSIKSNTVASVQQIMGRYAAKGTKLDFVIFGHIHCAFVSDMFARSASLCGDNAYGSSNLNLVGRASQNLHIFHEDGSRDSIKVDLQIPNESGYNIDKSLEAYAPKKSSRRTKGAVVFQVTI
jgi:predicted phosphodiesterase